MAYTTITPLVSSPAFAVDRIASSDFTRTKIVQGAEGVAVDVSPAAPFAVQIIEDPSTYVSGVSGSLTTTTPGQVLAAPGASLRNYIGTLLVSNSHATVHTDVEIQDGSGGTVLAVIPAQAVYGGGAVTFPIPLRQPTTNTALYAKSVMGGAAIRVTAVGYKGA